MLILTKFKKSLQQQRIHKSILMNVLLANAGFQGVAKIATTT